MENCLVTKLQRSVDDSSLMGLNAIRFKCVANDQSNNFRAASDQTLTIINDGTFKSNDLKTLNIPLYASTNIGATIGSIVDVPNKYTLTNLYLDAYTLEGDKNIARFKYSKNLLQLSFWVNFLLPKEDQLYGNIDEITENNTVLRNIVLPALKKITGNIKSLSNCSNLQEAVLRGTSVLGGSVDILYDKRLLETFSCDGLTGDIALLPANQIHIGSSGGKFTWSTRPSTSHILAINLYPSLGTYIDAMLQNLANCVEDLQSTAPISWRTINVKGTRSTDSSVSAATDAAIAVLQEKGYTIDILEE